jgi:hypothetical protein
VNVAVGVRVGVGVFVDVGVAVGVDVAVGVAVGVGVKVGTLVMVGVKVAVGLAVGAANDGTMAPDQEHALKTNTISPSKLARKGVFISQNQEDGKVKDGAFPAPSFAAVSVQ